MSIGKIAATIKKGRPKSKLAKSPEAIAKSSAKKVAKGVDKRASTIKKQNVAKKLEKDKERKAARGAARTAKKEAKQKIAAPSPMGMMGGNKPIAKRSGSDMVAPGRGGKRPEKVVTGERVDAPKVIDSAKTRPARGYSKKKAATATAVAAGVAGTAYVANKKEDSKKDTGERINIVADAAAKRKDNAPAPKSKGKLSEFGSAFKEARKKRIASGEDEDKATFEYKGKKYHTRTKEDEAKRKSKKK